MPAAQKTLQGLIQSSPQLAAEFAKLLASKDIAHRRTSTKYGGWQDMRKVGSALMRVLCSIAEESAEIFERDGLTKENLWRLEALSACTSELFHPGREGLGIAPLKAVCFAQPGKAGSNWRQQLVDVEAQAARAPAPDRPDGPVQDEREVSQSGTK